MSTQTPNYGLTKPTYPEPADVAVINGNMDIIDTQMKTNADDIDSVGAEVDSLETTLAQDVAKINAKDKTQDLKIKKLEAAAEGELYITDEDDDVAYIKDVDADALPVAMMTKLGGRTIVGNQLVQNGNFASASGWSGNSGTLTIADGIATVIASGNFAGISQSNKRYIKNHKYYFSLEVYRETEGNVSINNWLSLNTALGVGNANAWTKIRAIKEETTGGLGTLVLFNMNYSAGETCKFKNVMVIDLTQMFGAGNEPSTVEEVEAIIGTDYIDYNTGSLVSAKVNKIVSVGKNKFNKENITPNKWLNNQGEVENASQYAVSEYIPISPSTSYYFFNRGSIRTMFYDINKNVINAGQWGTDISSEVTVSSPNNAYYVRITVRDDYIDTFQLEKGSSATSYSPYKSIDHPIPQAIQDLDLWSAGNVYNEVDFVNKKFIKRVGSVDLGTLDYTKYFEAGQPEGSIYYFVSIPNHKLSKDCGLISSTFIYKKYITSVNDFSNKNMCSADYDRIYFRYDEASDANAMRIAMQGVMLYYELATPIETDLSDILTDDFLFEVEAGGTIEFVGNEDYNIPVPSTEVFYLKTV